MKVIAEIRRERLALLIAELGDISLAAMNDRLGRLRRDATLSQVLKSAPNTRTGRPRQMGDDQARDIERVFQKPYGWMDRDPDMDRMETQLRVMMAEEPAAAYRVWPFASIQPEQWRALTDLQRNAVEQLIASFTAPSETLATGTGG